jgi:hypothetical protein
MRSLLADAALRNDSFSPTTMERERFGSPSEDHQPITWLNGHAIYATHLIVLVYAVSMVVTALLGFGRVLGVSAWLGFNTEEIFRGQLWRYFTYGLWNPPSLNTAIDLLFLFMFGREVEKFFGRVVFLRLFAGIYLITPLLFTLIGIWRQMYLIGETGAFAVFIAFATLYPEAVLMFNVLAKWAALILVGIFSLVALSNHDLVGLLALWATVLFAFGFVRYQQGHFTLPRLRFPRRQPRLRVLPDLKDEAARPPASKPVRDTAMAEVDALLDKIAQSGIASLTAKERAKLDHAVKDLKDRDGRRS